MCSLGRGWQVLRGEQRLASLIRRAQLDCSGCPPETRPACLSAQPDVPPLTGAWFIIQLTDLMRSSHLWLIMRWYDLKFSWISVTWYILLRVNKYILASKKHILNYCCVYYMISLSFPSVCLCTNSIQSISFYPVPFFVLLFFVVSWISSVFILLYSNASVFPSQSVTSLHSSVAASQSCYRSSSSSVWHPPLTDISIVMLTVSFCFPHSLPSAFTP